MVHRRNSKKKIKTENDFVLFALNYSSSVKDRNNVHFYKKSLMSMWDFSDVRIYMYITTIAGKDKYKYAIGGYLCSSEDFSISYRTFRSFIINWFFPYLYMHIFLHNRHRKELKCRSIWLQQQYWLIQSTFLHQTGSFILCHSLSTAVIHLFPILKNKLFVIYSINALSMCFPRSCLD